MSAPIDVSDRPKGSVSERGHYLLSLTGPRSHILSTEAGRGNLLIGPASMGKKADLHVAPDDAIDWSAFDPFIVPAGYPWPRYIDYYGNDSGFFKWSQQREIEQFGWAPIFADRRAIDASAAGINRLQIRLENLSGHLDLTLPKKSSLGLFGDLSRFTAAGDLPQSLSLLPTLHRRHNEAPYVLPDLALLHDVASLSLHGNPLGQSISLKGVDRFLRLESLSLSGSFTDWAELAKLTYLENLEIRFAPDLTDIPPLGAWPKLDRFIAYNIDEAAGKNLKAQMKARGLVRAWDEYASVSKLRKPEWWQSEYGRPFAGWNSRLAKAANASYDSALAALEKAGTMEAAKAAITAFASHFNTMKGIETTEREDIGEAVWQFSQLAHVAKLGVTEEQALLWFDEVRDY